MPPCAGYTAQQALAPGLVLRTCCLAVLTLPSHNACRVTSPNPQVTPRCTGRWKTVPKWSEHGPIRPEPCGWLRLKACSTDKGAAHRRRSPAVARLRSLRSRLASTRCRPVCELHRVDRGRSQLEYPADADTTTQASVSRRPARTNVIGAVTSNRPRSADAVPARTPAPPRSQDPKRSSAHLARPGLACAHPACATATTAEAAGGAGRGEQIDGPAGSRRNWFRRRLHCRYPAAGTATPQRTWSHLCRVPHRRARPGRTRARP